MAKRKSKTDLATVATVADDSVLLAAMVAERDAAIRELAFPPATLLLTDQRLPDLSPVGISAAWLDVDMTQPAAEWPDTSDTPADVLAPTVASFVLQVDDSFDDAVTAAVLAEGYAKALRVRVCVVDVATGQRVRCFDPPVRRARGETAEKAEARQRGADWSSKSGQAVRLMMRDGGATMDEMREITGWTFGQKYVDQLARSFSVVITTREATARVKRTWHAVAVATEADDSDTGNVIDLAAALLAAD